MIGQLQLEVLERELRPGPNRVTPSAGWMTSHAPGESLVTLEQSGLVKLNPTIEVGGKMARRDLFTETKKLIAKIGDWTKERQPII